MTTSNKINSMTEASLKVFEDAIRRGWTLIETITPVVDKSRESEPERVIYVFTTSSRVWQWVAIWKFENTYNIDWNA
jgi:hypothetical protein